MVKRCWCLLLAVMMLPAAGWAQAPFVLSNSQVVPLSSAMTGRQHELVVMLPAGYAAHPEKSYPVLYFLDAYWDAPLLAATYGNLVYDNEVPEFIMVGLSYPSGANVDAERRLDYTITPMDPLSGQADRFLDFIQREVAPLIETRYRGAASGRIIAGSSLGGLFAIAAAYKAPDFFAAHIAISPAVSWDHEALVKLDQRWAGSARTLHSRMFISYGTAEHPGFSEPIKRFQNTLAARRYKGLALSSYRMAGLDHTSVKGDGYVRGLIWAFKPHKPPGPSGLTRALTAAPRAQCGAPVLPEFAALTPLAGLPDPFRFANGSRAGTMDEWTCRRAELSAQVQKYELGRMPGGGDPLSAEMTGQGLQVTVTHEGKAISFPVNIALPPTGKAPYPALIGMGGVSLNNDELAKMGVAIITFPNNELAEQRNAGSRGKGKFYSLFGSAHPAGAMSAWSWGLSRTIDALEKTPAAMIDPKRLAVTGCSRNGKGAIVAGALDERIALTIAQESGAGGAAGWRVSEAQWAAGQNVQTLRQIVTENVWFTEGFQQFGPSVAKLPFDQHAVMGLIAPRGLLVLENTSMEWLGKQSAYINALAAREVWKALGRPDAMGLSQVGGHAHCQLPPSQYRHVNNFVRKFLLGDASADTAVLETDGAFATDTRPWMDWTAPALK